MRAGGPPLQRALRGGAHLMRASRTRVSASATSRSASASLSGALPGVPRSFAYLT